MRHLVIILVIKAKLLFFLPIVKEVLKLLRSALHVPEMVANPFTLNLCLSLTSLKHYRQQLVECLKGTKIHT